MTRAIPVRVAVKLGKHGMESIRAHMNGVAGSIGNRIAKRKSKTGSTIGIGG